jgi:prefoldin subunit 5
MGVFKNLIAERTADEVQEILKSTCYEVDSEIIKVMEELRLAEKILKEIRDDYNPSYLRQYLINLKRKADEYFKNKGE